MTGRAGLRYYAVLTVGVLTCAADGETPPSSRLRYEGTLGWAHEVPEGAEPSRKQPDAPTSGYIVLKHVSEQELEVYEEAVGCRIRARSEDGQVFSATSASCVWDGEASLQALGFVERTFDSWQYDTTSGRLEAEGTTVRVTAAGQRMVAPFKLDLTIGVSPSVP